MKSKRILNVIITLSMLAALLLSFAAFATGGEWSFQ